MRTVYRYTSYGRPFTSDHPLNLAPDRSEAEPAFCLTVGGPGPDPEDADTGYLMPDLIELALHPGHHVHVRPLAELTPAVLEHLIVDVAIPTALTAWDQPVVHASAVDWGDGAVLFTGPSGSGKSTLALAAASRGARLVADDGILVDLAAHTATGSVTTLRLHGDHAAEVLPAVEPGEVVTPTGKRQIDPSLAEIAVAEGARSLRALFAIDGANAGTAEGDAINLARCGAAEAADVIVRSFLSPPGSTSLSLRYLEAASSIAAWLPVFRLTYPRDRDLLDEVLCAAREATEALPDD